jgi:hypothetical protein
VSLPSSERVNPRDVAKATAIAGCFHDVVVSASKLLHDGTLDSKDRASLRWARGLLEAAASKDVMLSMPSAQELTGTTNAVLVLRRAARPDTGDDPDSTLLALRDAIDDALRGQGNERLAPALESLRELFSMVSRLALQAEVVAQGEQAGGSWPPSTTTLPS